MFQKNYLKKNRNQCTQNDKTGVPKVLKTGTYVPKNDRTGVPEKTRNRCSKMIDQVFQNDRTVTGVPKMIKTGAGVPKMLRKIPTIFTKVFLQIRN